MKKILFPLFLLLAGVCYAQPPQKAVLDVENNNDFSSFEILQNAGLQNYSLFFTGEDHRYRKSNAELELKTFKYLHKNAGVRVFLLEFGYSMGYIVNRYVIDGDSVANAQLEKHVYKEYYNLFKGLREFYESLPADEKFRVEGIDLEREPVYPVKMMELLLPEKFATPPHDSISIHLDAIRAVSEYFDKVREDADEEDEEYKFGKLGDGGGYDRDTLKKYDKTYISIMHSVVLIRENFANHREKYQQALGDNFILFEQIMTRLDAFFYWDELSSSAQDYLYRETYMEKNLLALYTSNPGMKAYGQFGRCHTPLLRKKEECPYFYFNALATRMNKSSHPALAGKVFSCPVYYPYMDDFIDDDVNINAGLKSFINEADKNELTLFLLDTAQPAHQLLAERFKAVIINYLEEDKSASDEDSIGPPKSVLSYNYDERFNITVDAGFSGYNFGNVNSTLHTHFTNNPQFYGFSIGMAANRDVSAFLSYRNFPQAEGRVNDSLTTYLRGNQVKFRIGKDLTRSKKTHFMLYMGMGYENWVLDMSEKNSDPARRDLFGNDKRIRYTNPAFLFDAGIDFKVYINYITVGFFGGYQLDVSKRKWRQNGVTELNSPSLSLNSYFVGASLGINIRE